ncbi:MAG: hypothetical protein NUV41_14830 [Eubacteriales bacterium]|jgi:hypothetical protein|nr:hypothetical protein [Eubacteriales bacterium]
MESVCSAYTHRQPSCARDKKRPCLQAGFTIADRRHIGHEDDIGYHHYAIDVAKEYEVREE